MNMPHPAQFRDAGEAGDWGTHEQRDEPDGFMEGLNTLQQVPFVAFYAGDELMEKSLMRLSLLPCPQPSS